MQLKTKLVLWSEQQYRKNVMDQRLRHFTGDLSLLLYEFQMLL